MDPKVQRRQSRRLKHSTGPTDTEMIHGPLPQSPRPQAGLESKSLTRTVPVVTRSGWRPSNNIRSLPPRPGKNKKMGAEPVPTQAATVAPSEPIQAASVVPVAETQPPSDALPAVNQAAKGAETVPTQAAKGAEPVPTQAAMGAEPVPTQAAPVAPSELTQAASVDLGAEMQPLKNPKRKRTPQCRQEPTRRSKRLNPENIVGPSDANGPENLASTPQQCPKSAPTRVPSQPRSNVPSEPLEESHKRPESVSSVKTFRGPNPTNPKFKPKKKIPMRAEGSTPLSSQQEPGWSGCNPEVSVEKVVYQMGVEDDGSRRIRLRLPLSACVEARGLSGKELDPLEQKDLFGKKRKSGRKGKGKKNEKPRGRGLAKVREPARPEDRPELYVVGDAEFRSSTKCTKVVSTIRLLTVSEMPGPCRTYNRFPSRARIEILRRFLQRYSWGPGEDEGRCLEVFEKIAAEAYGRILNKARKACDNKYGPVKELWKQDCPLWCKDESYWRALCDVWSNESWEKESFQAHLNRKNNGPKINHVGGSRSAYKHKEALEAEMGNDFGMKALFDRLHTKDGTVYVNERAQRVASTYNDLKYIHVELPEERLWEIAAEGEDRRGRVFGFGNKARICKASREFQAMEASHTATTRSTATSAEDATKTFTQAQVAALLSETISAERRAFANDAAAQEERHKAELAAVRKQNERTAACIEVLYKKIGAEPPKFDEGPSNA